MAAEAAAREAQREHELARIAEIQRQLGIDPDAGSSGFLTEVLRQRGDRLTDADLSRVQAIALALVGRQFTSPTISSPPLPLTEAAAMSEIVSQMDVGAPKPPQE